MKCYLFGLALLSSLCLFPQPSLAASDARCLALNIYHEARGEPTVGQIAVAFVTINRLRTAGFPKSICGVVYDEGKVACSFSWVCSHPPLPHDSAAWKKSLGIAKFVLDKDNILSDPTYGSLYYHEADISPLWSRNMLDYITLGSHKFYFERKEYP